MRISVFLLFRTTARAPVFYMEEKTILLSNIYATSFGAGAHEKDHATRILSHVKAFLQTDPFLVYLFFYERKAVRAQ